MTNYTQEFRIIGMLLLIVFFANHISSQTYTWTGNGGNTNWCNLANWGPPGSPISGPAPGYDALQGVDVVIPAGLTARSNCSHPAQNEPRLGKITIYGTMHVGPVKGLRLSNGTSVIDVNGTMTVQNTNTSVLVVHDILENYGTIIQNSGGRIQGSGHIYNKDMHRLAQGGPKHMTEGGLTYHNEGTFEIVGSGNFFFRNGTFVNESGGVIDIQSDADILRPFAGDSGQMENFGMVKKSGGTDLSFINVKFFNYNGTLKSESAHLRFNGHQSQFIDGWYDADAGSSLYLARMFAGQGATTHTLKGTLRGNPAGSVGYGGDPGQGFGGVAALVTTADSAWVDFGGTGFKWTGGNITGTNTHLINLGLMNITGSTKCVLTGSADIYNRNTLTFNGGNLIMDQAATRIHNEAGAVFDFQHGGDIRPSTFVTPGRIQNYGTIRRTLAGDSQMEVPFTNFSGGDFDIQQGILRFYNSGTFHDATYQISAGAQLYFGWNYWRSFHGMHSGNIQGTLRFANGSLNVPTAATFNFSGTGFKIRPGDIRVIVRGNGVLTNEGLVELSTDKDVQIIGSIDFRNEGIIRAADNVRIALYIENGEDPRITNAAGGLFEITGGADFIDVGFRTEGRFYNAGVFQKNGVDPTQMYTRNFNNQPGGVINLLQDRLHFRRKLTLEDGSIVQGNADIRTDLISPQANFVNNADWKPGTSPGVLHLEGHFKPTDDGSLTIELGGATPGNGPGFHDQLTVAKSAALNGTLDVLLEPSFVPTTGQQFVIMTCNNCSGAFDVVNTPASTDFQVIVNANEVILEALSNDSDGDGIPDNSDNCINTPNPGQENNDGDSLGDVCDDDDDNDGCLDVDDANPFVASGDTDNDGDPDDCDICPFDADNDIDGDGICGDVDNCPAVSNPGQENNDGDSLGDVCDDDDDNDGCLDVDDANPFVASGDTDNDGDPDDCDICPFDADNDIDGDGICGDVDNCPAVSNPGQENNDGDSLGDVCDDDDDNDGCLDVDDANPFVASGDTDNDGDPDDCDICPFDADNDIDGDGICGDVDNCPVVSNPGQENNDGDSLGDVCDDDDDNDGCLDVDDANPFVASGDTDNDGDPDDCDICPFDADNDIDGDGICGDVDNCPDDANPGQEDLDCDGVGDECDLCPDVDDSVDNNGDGLPDCAYPPDFEDILDDWICKKKKVLMTVNPNNPHTICVNKNSISAHINNGGFLGPLMEDPCGQDGFRVATPRSVDQGDFERFEVSIYPNPVVDQMYMKKSSHEDDVTMTIYDQLGRKVFVRTINNRMELVELSLENGPYFAEFVHQKERIIRPFIVIR